MKKRKISPKYHDYSPYKKGRDNRGYYNSRGGICSNHNSMRIPSLKESNKVWNEFYKLFPNIKEYLVSGDNTKLYGTYKDVYYDEKRGVYLVRKERNTGIFSVKLLKFKKSW